MQIYINGETENLERAISLQELIEKLQLKAATFAIALNETFVSRANYQSTILQANDRVEIVNAMQGG